MRVADHDRAEHALRAAVEQVVEQRLQDQQPEPGVPEHLTEAGADVARACRRSRARQRRHPDAGEGHRGHREGAGVDGQRPATARGDHDQPGQAGAAHPRGVLAEPPPADRLLQQLRRDRLLGDRRRARVGQRSEGADQHAGGRQERRGSTTRRSGPPPPRPAPPRPRRCSPASSLASRRGRRARHRTAPLRHRRARRDRRPGPGRWRRRPGPAPRRPTRPERCRCRGS